MRVRFPLRPLSYGESDFDDDARSRSHVSVRFGALREADTVTFGIMATVAQFERERISQRNGLAKPPQRNAPSNGPNVMPIWEATPCARQGRGALRAVASVPFLVAPRRTLLLRMMRRCVEPGCL